MHFSALACHLDAKLTPRYFKNKRSSEINRPPRMIAIRAANDDDKMASERSRLLATISFGMQRPFSGNAKACFGSDEKREESRISVRSRGATRERGLMKAGGGTGDN